MDLNQVTLPARDMERSKGFYRGMGFRLIVDSPHYARFECPEGESTFSLHIVEELRNPTGVVVYFESERLDEWVQELEAKGYRFDHGPRDETWLWREARLTDPDGNQLCLYRAGEMRRNPPWRVADA